MTRLPEQIAVRVLLLCAVLACQGGPTMPTALPVSPGPTAAVFEPANSYTVCEFLITQYAHRNNVTTWWDKPCRLCNGTGWR
jgi:hypothetical protein